MSMNRDKQFAPLLPKEEVEKQRLYSEPLETPRTVHDAPYDYKKVKRLQIAVAVLTALVVILAASTILLRTMYTPRIGEALDLEYYAVKMNLYGLKSDKGQVSLSGKFAHYGGYDIDQFMLDSLQIMNNEVTDVQLNCWSGREDGAIVLGHGEFYIVISADTERCVVYKSGYYYICSTQADFDTDAVFAELIGTTE